jgi:hypothetical protein
MLRPYIDISTFARDLLGERNKLNNGCIWRKANIFVGAKHDLREYGIITNNLYAVMLRPLQR